MSLPAYVPTGAAARLLGVHVRTVGRWLRRGTLRGRRECPRCEETDPSLGEGCKACRYFVFRAELRERIREADAPISDKNPERRESA